jgi:hypothetical protein
VWPHQSFVHHTAVWLVGQNTVHKEANPVCVYPLQSPPETIYVYCVYCIFVQFAPSVDSPFSEKSTFLGLTGKKFSAVLMGNL